MLNLNQQQSFAQNNSKNLPPINQPNIQKNNIFEKKPLQPSNQQNIDPQAPQPNQKKNIDIENSNIKNENAPPPNNLKMNQKDKNKKEKRVGIKKNLTDNKVALPQDISQEDRVGEDYNADNNDESLTILQKEKALRAAAYKEDLKTGKFIHISNKYMDQIMDDSMEDTKEHEGYIDEDSKWYKLIDDFNSMIFRFVFLLQGLLTGLLIMIAITSIQQNWAEEDYRYRLNQTIWIISLICFFGQIYIYKVCDQRCEYSFTNGSPHLQENRSLKIRALVNVVCKNHLYLLQQFYGAIYYCIMICHYYASMLSYTGTGSKALDVGDNEKNGYTYLIIISAVISFIGWLVVGNQTKSNYVEMEYDDDDLTKPGDDSDEEF